MGGIIKVIGEKMYNKIILTIIAICLVGINIYLFNDFVFTDAHAMGRLQILKLIDLNCAANGSDIICRQSNLLF